MNEILKKFLLAGDKFMTEMHLSPPGFKFCTSGTFAKNKERIQKFKETQDSRYFQHKELDKTCVEYGIAYGDFNNFKQSLVQYYVIKHLILLKTQKMMDINVKLQ